MRFRPQTAGLCCGRNSIFDSMRITFLGTGTSHGVPPLDCMIQEHRRCKKDVCRLSQRDPLHCRTRSSILVEWDGCAMLIDPSLDFRQQALRERIRRIDAVLVTHSHADHIGGIPDLRSYTWQRPEPLPVYGSAETVQRIRTSYDYIFNPETFVGGGIPNIRTVAVSGPFTIAGHTIVPIIVTHGSLAGCFGFRLGGLVYIPDLKSINDREMETCRNAEVLVLNCLRDEREHVSHLILPQSMELARRLAPKRCYFIHMCHDIHYETDSAGLEPWMAFSHDGLHLEI